MEPKKTSKQQQQFFDELGPYFAMGRAEAKRGPPLTKENLQQVLMEFRKLQLEVKEIKGADTPEEPAFSKEKVTFRYQLYYRDGYLQRARLVMADGLATFLKDHGAEWPDKDCSFTVIGTDQDGDGWSAIRIDAVV